MALFHQLVYKAGVALLQIIFLPETFLAEHLLLKEFQNLLNYVVQFFFFELHLSVPGALEVQVLFPDLSQMLL
jgi:hypothetical protein